MRIDYPAQEQLPGLRQLWKEAFGDSDAFLDGFFEQAFAPDRCRCVTEDGQLAAALYWFDCRCADRPMAYLYAIATGKSFRGRGLCRALMEDTKQHLQSLGYAGILLVPARGLAEMYEKMGYEDSCGIGEFPCAAGEAPVPLRSVDAAEYARLRRQLLPANGVLQEGSNLAFLETLARLYAGEDFLLAAVEEGDTLMGLELLGNREAAPGILAALEKRKGSFRTPGRTPFAMYLPLSDCPKPDYFGLAFD